MQIICTRSEYLISYYCKLFVLRIVTRSYYWLLRIIISSIGWNDKIVAQEKTTWFHFRRMKTGFLFFAADHLLVGQLCTNPKSDRNLLSCLKVTQCSTSEIEDAPQYNPCSLPIQVMITGPLPAPSKCKSGRFNAWGHNSTHWTTLWRWWSGRPHHATSHLRSRLESQHQSVPGCAEECGNPLVQSGGRWQTLGVTAGLGTGQQVQRDPGLASGGVLRLCTLARPWEGVYRSTSLMSSSLLLQQCPACLVHLIWIVFVMCSRWPYCCCFVGCCLQDLFNIARSIFV